ncbi:MAG: hypothetical protein KME11_04040 [Timaviella obliquedivisa GSE-PSE-MK23-08B]|jgi:glycerol-3-phosphate dehydrogenase|nr:hypothetical protein [Timaviella obliquedivisa GSE-PSE-MK23-08B]
MEKKVRIKKLNRQDDIKRSWSAVYPLTEDFEDSFPEEWDKAATEPNFEENTPSPCMSSHSQYDEDDTAK